MWKTLNRVAIIVAILGGVAEVLNYLEQGKGPTKAATMISDVVSPAFLNLTVNLSILFLLLVCLWRQNALKTQIEEHISTTTPSAPLVGLFKIEPHYIELHWSEQGKNELQPFHPEITVPNNATLTLQIKAKITALPRPHVENFQLELTGQHPPLLAQEWIPKIIGQHNNLPLYFRIPSFIPNGRYSAILIATIKEGDSTISIQSSPFNIILTRSYDDLPK
jgi:hypothetical protein